MNIICRFGIQWSLLVFLLLLLPLCCLYHQNVGWIKNRRNMGKIVLSVNIFWKITDVTQTMTYRFLSYFIKLWISCVPYCLIIHTLDYLMRYWSIFCDLIYHREYFAFGSYILTHVKYTGVTHWLIWNCRTVVIYLLKQSESNLLKCIDLQVCLWKYLTQLNQNIRYFNFIPFTK